MTGSCLFFDLSSLSSALPGITHYFALNNGLQASADGVLGMSVEILIPLQCTATRVDVGIRLNHSQAPLV